MGTGVCLKGTKVYPLSTAGLFEFNDVYILIEMPLSFQIKFYVFLREIHILF